jgi:hypothetical protein
MRKLQELANHNPQVRQLKNIQEMADHSPRNQELAQLRQTANEHSAKQEPPVQKRENKTGLPDSLKTGIENLSGYSMDDVKVHYNSHKPAQLQAHAYTQGTDIHVGSGQERHLPHEAWHVVQQKQGRVKPTMQMKGKVNVNDSAWLEKEADEMGARAARNEQAVLSDGDVATGAAASNMAIQQKAAAPVGPRYVIQRQVIATKQNNAGTFTFDHISNTKTIDDIYAQVEVEIAFRLKDDAPNEARLYLSQIVQHHDITSGGLYNYASSNKKQETAEAARDLVRTTGEHGEEAGFFIDNIYATTDVDEGVAAMNAPRTSSLDAPRSAAYNMTGAASHGRDGSKTDVSNNPATLKDTPGSGKPTKFTFETAALGTTAGPYGVLPWSVVLGRKDVEPVITVANATNALSKNFTEAQYKFNEFFRNRGAATSPERFNALIDIPTRGLTGIQEAVTTLEKLTSQVETLMAMPNSEATAAMIVELKDTIRYRFEAIDVALADATAKDADLERAAFYRQRVAVFKLDAASRIGALG